LTIEGVNLVAADKPENIPNNQVGPNVAATATASARTIEIPSSTTVKQLSELLQVSSVDVIKRLMKSGIMANINQSVDFEAASAVVTSLGCLAKLKVQSGAKSVSLIREIKNQQLHEVKGENAGLKARPPVVTVMGHVDHGKTRLLDAIRHTNVMGGETGGITQHIGAYQVEVNGQKITFLDTPGHEAFTAMRARGARLTDIAVLVVAADDGVMPQTLEAINHAKAAGVPIVVAITKVDKPEANPDRIKQQLADAGLVVEEWGGETIAVEVSARENKNIDKLLENLLIVAEMEELRADPHKPAEGVVIEANMDKSKGVLATVLVHNGTLRVGDIIVVGDSFGKIKAMFNSDAKQVRKAEPATPVEILGLSVVPLAGDNFSVATGEAQARAMVEKRKLEAGQKQSSPAVTLTNIKEQVSQGNVKELNVILKADVQGSIEPIKSSLEQLSTDELKVRVLHSGTGIITENDIMLALASKGIIIGFNAIPDTGAKRLAEREGISIRNYGVIYQIIDDVNKALKGLLTPSKTEVITGRAEVRQVFPASKKLKAAGVLVVEGKLNRGASIRVKRKNKVVNESIAESLRRFKEDVNEVATGYECGVLVKDFDDFQVGDILEFYKTEVVG
jgi:translation initiation factor IF-2